MGGHDREEIVYAAGNSQHAAFKPKGIEPLHLNIWFRASAEPTVLQLLHDLEAMTAAEP